MFVSLNGLDDIYFPEETSEFELDLVQYIMG